MMHVTCIVIIVYEYYSNSIPISSVVLVTVLAPHVVKSNENHLYEFQNNRPNIRTHFRELRDENIIFTKQW